MAASELLDEPGFAPEEDIGATLRDAREAAGFSIADVAERMRLSRHHIENLEAERFELFPVSVFLRGYLTSYARLVGVEAGPLLEAYDRRGFEPPQLHSQDTARAPARGSEFTVTVTTIIVIAVLIVLSALWWRDQWTDGDGLPSTTMEHPEEGGILGDTPEGPGEPAGSPLPDGEPGPGETPGRDGAAVAPAGELPPLPAGSIEPPPVPFRAEPPDGESAPGAAGPAQGPPARAEDAGEPAESVAGEAPEPAPADAETAEPDAAPDATPDATAAPAQRPAAGEDGAFASLVIRIREDCWLMIRDADQHLIYRDLAAAGTVLEFSAAPPIRVVAGYAEGVEIEYNGEPFDPSPFVEQDTGTARFRLGA